MSQFIALDESISMTLKQTSIHTFHSYNKLSAREKNVLHFDDKRNFEEKKMIRYYISSRIDTTLYFNETIGCWH